MFDIFKGKKKSDTPKVLLVDDDPEYVGTIQHHLQCRNYEIVVAVNGKEALEKALFDKPDIILLDIMMPVMDGWETLESLKMHPDLKDIPIIMVTARCEVQDINRACQYGVANYIVKPFDMNELMDKITTVLEKALSKI